MITEHSDANPRLPLDCYLHIRHTYQSLCHNVQGDLVSDKLSYSEYLAKTNQVSNN